MWFYILIEIIILIILAAGVAQFFNILFRGQAPFFISKKKVIKKIIKEIELKPNNIFYELGSGSAGILKQLDKKYKRVKLVGLEYSLVPWFIAKLQAYFQNSNVIIRKKNFFKADLSQVDYIYCFLNIETMAKLENKFIKECKKGAIIISYTFQLPHLKPYKVITLKKDRIYFYKI